jgi:hypothetical protein
MENEISGEAQFVFTLKLAPNTLKDLPLLQVLDRTSSIKS